jgi:Putative peptidoglycan binding domain
MKKRFAFIMASIAAMSSASWAQSSVPNTAAPQPPAVAASVGPAPPANHSQRRHGRAHVNKDVQQTPGPVQRPTIQQHGNSGAGKTTRHRSGESDRPRRETPAVNYSEASRRQHRERHNRGWWRTRYVTIVFVTGQGYYYWDAGYWFPAWGYDPANENYDYNGPIYTYGNLLPDQVIYNVQQALKELGYYGGALSGSMSAATRAAISAFQADNGLDVTGGIDAPTVEGLGLD